MHTETQTRNIKRKGRWRDEKNGSIYKEMVHVRACNSIKENTHTQRERERESPASLGVVVV